METDSRGGQCLIEWNVMESACPTRQVLDRVADKWTMLVILALEGGPARFSEVRRTVQGVTQKMLTQTLRGMERDGLLTREVKATVPVTVTYSLTELGASLSGTVAAVRSWAYANMPTIEAARSAYDQRSA